MSMQLNINIFNLLILASVFIGITFSILLIFAKRINLKANRFLGLVLLIITLWDVFILSIDFNLHSISSIWNWIPLSFLLAIGPCLFTYVKLLSSPEFKISKQFSLHFIPVLLELGLHFFQAYQGWKNNILTIETDTFFMLNPFLQFLSIISVIVYLVLSLKELKVFHKWLKDNYSNEYQYQLNWLKRLLIILGMGWVLWVPFILVDYFIFDYMLTINDYYPLYIMLATITIWIGAEAFLRPEIILLEPKKEVIKASKTPPSAEVLKESVWLKEQVEKNQLFLNSEITLKTLALELEIHPNTLSKIINEGFGKNFSDFINEYRVKEVISKINDPKYDHITLLGLGLECGFNSKTTFNRIFKKMTGKTPITYKNTINDTI